MVPGPPDLPVSVAYLSWGRWVADCPRCTDARAVYPYDRTGQPGLDRVLDQTCDNGHRFRIEMPTERQEARIMATVANRPGAEQVWWPKGHPMAPPTQETADA